MSNVETRVQQCFSIAFPDFTPEEIQGAVLDDTPLWDSMATVMLITVIEEEFASMIDPVDFDQLTSYKAIVGYLQKKIPAPVASTA